MFSRKACPEFIEGAQSDLQVRRSDFSREFQPMFATKACAERSRRVAPTDKLKPLRSLHLCESKYLTYPC